MMYAQAKFQSSIYQDVVIVKLPYEGERFSMYILMPTEGYDLSTAQDLIMENLDLDEFLDEKVLTDFYMPKFKIESTHELEGTLTNLGLSLIFDPFNADLTGLNANPKEKSLYVDKAVQKAFISKCVAFYSHTVLLKLKLIFPFPYRSQRNRH